MLLRLCCVCLCVQLLFGGIASMQAADKGIVNVKSNPKGVTQFASGQWLVEFEKSLPVTYAQANWSDYQSERYDDDATRIRFKQSGPASHVIFDVQRLTHMDQATDLQLAVYGFAGTWKSMARQCILEVSADGVNYQTLPTVQSDRIKSVPSGRHLVYLRPEKSAIPFRYVRVHLENIEQAWQVGITNLLLSDKPLNDFVSVFDGQAKDDQPREELPVVSAIDLPVYSVPQQMRESKLFTLMQGICFDTTDVVVDQLNLKKIGWQKAELEPLSFYGVRWQIENQDDSAKCALYRAALDVTVSDLADRLVMIFPQTFFVFDVYLDGKPVAQNRQGMAYAEVDLTGHLHKAGRHELLIKVRDYYAALQSGKVVLPIGSQYRYRRGFERAPMIERRPMTSMVQPFVMSDVDKQQVTATVALTQGSSHADHLRITLCDNKQQTVIEKTMALADEQMPTIALDVQDRLSKWDIGKPNLYDCQFTLLGDGKVIDQISTRFGYRTVSTRGEDILLNGRKIQLIGPWAHIGEWTRSRGWVEKTDDFKADLVNVYKTMLSHGINYGRLHCQIFDRIFYEAADEAGFLIAAESGLNHRPKNQAALDHIKQMALQLRNHPAIVIWSGSNEFEHWITPRPADTEAFMVKVQEVFKQYDPSRLVQQSGYGDAQGKIDIYNIHYPEAGGKEFPRSLYWKGLSEQFNHLYSDNYTHFPPDGKKPIGIGEHLTPTSKLELEHVYGDQMTLLRNGDPTNYLQYITWQGRFWRQVVRSYREQNIAILSPNFTYIDDAIHSNFLTELSKELKPQTAYWQQLNPDLKTGENARELLLFEQSGHPFEGYAQLACKVGKRVLWEQRLPVSLNASQRLSQQIVVTLPTLQADEQGTLSSTLFDAAGQQVYSMKRDVKLYAPIQASLLAGRMVYGMNVPQTLIALLKDWQVQFKALASPSDIATLPQNALVVVGKDVANEQLQSHAQAIGTFVAQGGRLLMLARAVMPDIFPSQIVTTQGTLNGATQGFVRSEHHAFFTQAALPMDDLDFAYWGDDLKVSDDNCYKPISGNFHILVDGGTELNDALLVELIHGGGRMVVSQLLLDKAPQTPAAAKVWFNLVDYLSRTSPAQKLWGRGCYLKGSDAYAVDLLSNLGWQQYDSTLSDVVGLYVDDQSLSQMSLEKAAQIARPMRFVHVHMTDPTLRDRFTKLLVGSSPMQINSPVLGTKSKPINLLYAIAQHDPLVDGLAGGDLNWTTHPQPQPVMFKADAQWDVPMYPGVLAIHRAAGQTILADIASWKQVVDNDERRMRFLCSISTQMGVELAGRSIRSSSGSTIHTVNLKPFCNVSASQYLGPNMPTGQVQLHDIPFDFAKATEGNPATMIRLNSRVGTDLQGKKVLADTPIDNFDLITPQRITIEMGKVHASKIYFAHATTFNYRIKNLGNGANVCQYRINYADGTDAMLTMTLRREIQDARKTYDDGRSLLMGTQFLNPVNGDGEQMAIGIYTWENPSPEKKIKSIELISSQNPHMDPMLFALSYNEFADAFE